MKKLQKLLLLVLALVMSTSVFVGCGDSGDGKDDDVVELKYVFDYQVLDNASLAFEVEGNTPDEVLFGPATAETDDDLYGLDAEFVNEKLNVEVVGEMMGAKEDKIVKFSTDKKNYKIALTVNPITDNYFVVDGGEASYTIATTAQATDVKFNGTAAGTGITVSATGITFDKSLFTGDTMGHNKVEYTVGDTKYVVSVCAVTKNELAMPILFEDGKMTPFMSVFGRKHGVVKVDKMADADVKEYYSKYSYQYGNGANKEVKANSYALEIYHKAGQQEQLFVYMSTFYVDQRVKAVATFDETVIAPASLVDGILGGDKVAYDAFASGTAQFKWRILSGEFSANGGESDYYAIVNGVDDAASAGKYFWITDKHLSNNRSILAKSSYDAMVDANGKLVNSYYTMSIRDASDNHYLYIDDVTAVISSYAPSLINKNYMPIPKLG